MSVLRLRLYKGYNNGIENGSLSEMDSNGVKSIFDLTGGTVSMDIYDTDGTVLVNLPGTVISAALGTYYVRPGSTALNAVTAGEHLYRIKVVSATFAQGRLFDQDADGRQLRCYVV